MRRFPFIAAFFLYLSIQSIANAGTIDYEFLGHFAPTNLVSNSNEIYKFPSSLLNAPFKIRASFSDQIFSYFGEQPLTIPLELPYITTREVKAKYFPLVSLTSDTAGIGFSKINHLDSVVQNDGPFKTNFDTQTEVGDYFRYSSVIFSTITFTSDEYDINGNKVGTSTFTNIMRYNMSLHLIDRSGDAIAADNLATGIDLDAFDDIHFEFRHRAFSSNADGQVEYYHFIGVIDSIIAVPEPEADLIVSVLFIIAIVSLRQEKLKRFKCH